MKRFTATKAIMFLFNLIIFSLLFGCQGTTEISCEKNFSEDGYTYTFCLEIVAILDEPLEFAPANWLVYFCELDEECLGLISGDGYKYGGIDASFGIDHETLADIDIYEGALVWVRVDTRRALPDPRPAPIAIIDWKLME